MTELGLSETASGRPFTAPAHTAHDMRIIDRMVRRLRSHAGDVVKYASDATTDDRRMLDDDGSLHHIVLPELRSLTAESDLAAVGFFGQARVGVDHTPIGDLEQQLISNMGDDDGLMAYYNVHWPAAGWGNLVLFADVERERAWGDDARHVEAVCRAPMHYHSIRLHTGLLAGGFPGTARVRLLHTTYLDYGGALVWRAGRNAR